MRKETLQDIYPLSPMQQGILFHCLRSPGSGLYIDQEIFELHGTIQHDTMRQAWLAVSDTHPILRTSFHWKASEKTLQVVHRHVQVPWDLQDWRGLSPDEQKTRLQAFLQTDRVQGFLFDEPPLMRVAVISLTQDTTLLIWTVHHLLLEAGRPLWCSKTSLLPTTRSVNSATSS